MKEAYFKIADIVIKIISPFPFVTKNGEDFRCNKTKHDYTFIFKQHENIQEFISDSQMVANLLWGDEYKRMDGTFVRAFLWEEKYYHAVTVMGEKEGTCYYSLSDILADKAEDGFELWMYLCLEQILLQYDAVVLHSSYVAFDNKGIVFSAPSGTGKSTQADLWEKYVHATVINGDRSVLRKKSGIWNVYGCPMCGTSGIHKQGCEPLTNIIMLSQGKENRAVKISGKEAFCKIYPEITCPKWDSRFIGHVMDLLDEIIREVSVWHYSCTKEKEAVFTLKRLLKI